VQIIVAQPGLFALYGARSFVGEVFPFISALGVLVPIYKKIVPMYRFAKLQTPK
jgi:hypothetical protein